MTQASVTLNAFQATDVFESLPTELTFDRELSVQQTVQPLHIIVGEFPSPPLQRQAESSTNLNGTSLPQSMQVLQGNIGWLVVRNIHTEYTGHCPTPQTSNSARPEELTVQRDQRGDLTLALFVTRVGGADDIDSAFPANLLTMLTNLFYARSNLHDITRIELSPRSGVVHRRDGKKILYFMSSPVF
jgi:hypothetical protein